MFLIRFSKIKLFYLISSNVTVFNSLKIPKNVMQILIGYLQKKFLKHCDYNYTNNTLGPQSSSSSSFEGNPLQVRQKQDWGRGFILLLSQTAALPGSDVGSGIIKPASSFVIQNRQTSCSMWCPMYRARC